MKMTEEEILRIAAIHDLMVGSQDEDEIDEYVYELAKIPRYKVEHALRHRKRAKHNVDRRNKRVRSSSCGTCVHFNEYNGKCGLTGKVAKPCAQHQTLAELRKLIK